MPLKSYLAYPSTGRRDELAAALAEIPACEVLPAANLNLFVLVTDTPDSTTEKSLEAKLEKLDSLDCLALVAGAPDDEFVQIEVCR